MVLRRFAALGTAIAAAIGLNACSVTGQLASPNPNVSNARVFDYTAIAASDGVGVGSSKPCATAPVVVGSDTEQMPSPVDCPGGKSYVPVIAGLLTVNRDSAVLTDLGISSAVVGPTERTLGNTWEPFVFGCTPSGLTACVPGDFVTDEVPLMPAQVNTVTIFAGGNDANAIFAHVAVACASCTQQQVAAMIAADLTNFGNDYNTLLGEIHLAFPFARIYVANLPNFGLIPRGVCIGSDPSNPPPFCDPVNDPAQGNPAAQFLLDQITTALDANVINGAIAAAGIPVIDLECDPRSYDPANFSADGFHPNDAGYRTLAGSYAKAIRNFGAPPPAGSCGVFSQSGTRHPLRGINAKRLKMVRY